MGEAEAAHGDHRVATTLAEKALDRARMLGERGCKACARYMKADVMFNEAATRGDALQEFKKSLALASELGRRPLGARMSLGLARTHRQLGDIGAARDFLDDALARFREIDMRHWTKAAEHELSQLP